MVLATVGFLVLFVLVHFFYMSYKEKYWYYPKYWTKSDTRFVVSTMQLFVAINVAYVVYLSCVSDTLYKAFTVEDAMMLVLHMFVAMYVILAWDRK